MNYSKLQKMFGIFPDRATSQLKYYILTSFFPQLSKTEIKQITGISDNGLAPIIRTVEGYNLEPLSQILTEVGIETQTAAPATSNPDLVQLHDLIHELIDVKTALDNQAALEKQVQELEAEINELHNNQSNFDSKGYIPREDYEALERKVDLYEANWKAARHEATYFKNKYDKVYDLLKRIYEDRSKILDHYRKVEVQFMEVAGENAPPRKMWTSFTKEVRELEKVL